jgi:drug/metabolite transporter (DMT)-like permease
VTGLLMQFGYLSGVWMAVKAGVGAALAALIVNLQPVLTAVWVAWTAQRAGFGQGVTGRQWLGLALGFGGLILVMARKFGAGGEANAVNVGLLVMALLAMTAGALYQKRFVTTHDVRTASAVQLAAALVATAPLAWFEAEPLLWHAAGGGWNWELIGAMAWSVLILTLGGSSLLYLLITRGAATTVTSYLYLVPPATALMAWVLFGEEISLLTLAGTAITALGVYLVVRQT